MKYSFFVFNVFLTLTITFISFLVSKKGEANPNINSQCTKLSSFTIPSEDQPNAKEKIFYTKDKENCLSYLLEAKKNEDWSKYRKCLLSQNEISEIFLAEIYANGWGVKRNPALAMALICKGSVVPAELESMMDFLSKTKAEKKLKEEFLFCHYITSGMSSSLCARRSEIINSKEREKKAFEFKSNWTLEQKNDFEELEKKAKDFFSVHAIKEQDMSGTLGPSEALSEETRLLEEFFSSFKNFESGNFPKNLKKDFFKRTDDELNREYSKLMKCQSYNFPGSISKESIKNTELKWLKYRDAWVKFSSKKYSTIKADEWMTYLTEKRILQLKKIPYCLKQ